MVVCGNEGEVEENGIFVQCMDGDFVGGGSFGVVCVVCVVAWGHRLQSLVETAQWVARVVAWKN